MIFTSIIAIILNAAQVSQKMLLSPYYRWGTEAEKLAAKPWHYFILEKWRTMTCWGWLRYFLTSDRTKAAALKYVLELQLQNVVSFLTPLKQLFDLLNLDCPSLKGSWWCASGRITMINNKYIIQFKNRFKTVQKKKPPINGIEKLRLPAWSGLWNGR